MLEAKEFVLVHFAAGFTPFVISLMRARAFGKPASCVLYIYRRFCGQTATQLL